MGYPVLGWRESSGRQPEADDVAMLDDVRHELAAMRFIGYGTIDQLDPSHRIGAPSLHAAGT
jgi:hypothetical protein